MDAFKIALLRGARSTSGLRGQPSDQDQITQLVREGYLKREQHPKFTPGRALPNRIYRITVLGLALLNQLDKAPTPPI